jgi:urease accessory protein
MTKKLTISAIILALLSGVAQAHPDHGQAVGFAHGYMHPLSGWDHIVAMIAVGFFAATLGGRAIWAVPATFVAMMAAGGALGMFTMPLPFIEIGIMTSVVVLAGVAVLRWNASLYSAMALCGFFAVFHGFAHGAEMPTEASGITYALGFIAATALLHGVGLAAGMFAARRMVAAQG